MFLVVLFIIKLVICMCQFAQHKDILVFDYLVPCYRWVTLAYG
jgi:hypothetical protein